MSLADLLVSLAVLGLVMTSTVAVLQQGLQAYAFGAARVEVQQSARIALVRMAGEIRGAGYSAPGASFDAITAAEPTRIVLQVDANGDGKIAGNGETVTWLLRGTILRRDAGGGAQPIVNGVRSLAFVYLDKDGNVTPVPGAVRTVVITLTTEPDHAASAFAAGVASTFTTDVRLRNR
ncbi:MAG: hypothetical protein HY727_05660 [Candidatus Rokubacteria bacterium]|nr:hypothetical protein [Candidatus Rokubacteria bacterium]